MRESAFVVLLSGDLYIELVLSFCSSRKISTEMRKITAGLTVGIIGLLKRATAGLQ